MGQGAKRRRVNKACVYCHRSHLMCDSERPCGRCKGRNIAYLCRDEEDDLHTMLAKSREETRAFNQTLREMRAARGLSAPQPYTVCVLAGVVRACVVVSLELSACPADHGACRPTLTRTLMRSGAKSAQVALSAWLKHGKLCWAYHVLCSRCCLTHSLTHGRLGRWGSAREQARNKTDSHLHAPLSCYPRGFTTLFLALQVGSLGFSADAGKTQ